MNEGREEGGQEIPVLHLISDRAWLGAEYKLAAAREAFVKGVHELQEASITPGGEDLGAVALAYLQGVGLMRAKKLHPGAKAAFERARGEDRAAWGEILAELGMFSYMERTSALLADYERRVDLRKADTLEEAAAIMNSPAGRAAFREIYGYDIKQL